MSPNEILLHTCCSGGSRGLLAGRDPPCLIPTPSFSVEPAPVPPSPLFRSMFPPLLGVAAANGLLPASPRPSSIAGGAIALLISPKAMLRSGPGTALPCKTCDDTGTLEALSSPLGSSGNDAELDNNVGIDVIFGSGECISSKPSMLVVSLILSSPPDASCTACLTPAAAWICCYLVMKKDTMYFIEIALAKALQRPLANNSCERLRVVQLEPEEAFSNVHYPFDTTATYSCALSIVRIFHSDHLRERSRRKGPVAPKHVNITLSCTTVSELHNDSFNCWIMTCVLS